MAVFKSEAEMILVYVDHVCVLVDAKRGWRWDERSQRKQFHLYERKEGSAVEFFGVEGADVTNILLEPPRERNGETHAENLTVYLRDDAADEEYALEFREGI